MLKTELTAKDIEAFEPEAKVGLLATVSDGGLPHITLITTIRARTPTRLMWGQFSEGRSKRNVAANPRSGFLVLTMDKRLWRGKARWTGTETAGPNFEVYNNLPMFRYNAYFGIHTVHHMDLVETFGEERLPMAGIVASTILTRLSRLVGGGGRAVLKPWAQGVFNDMANLKFLAHVGEDGFPRLIPLIQCQARNAETLAFSTLAYGAELRAVPAGAPVAVFALTLKMESVLVRGVFSGTGFSALGPAGKVDIDWVYNSMPPKQGQIYPEIPATPVMEFH
jgi:pyridoxamine 5'-phosphate oxidase-like protein